MMIKIINFYTIFIRTILQRYVKNKFKILWDLQRSLLEVNLEHKLILNFDNLKKDIIKKQFNQMHSQKTSLWIQYLLYKEGVFLVDLMQSSIRLKILYKFIYKVYVIILTVILQPFLYTYINRRVYKPFTINI